MVSKGNVKLNIDNSFKKDILTNDWLQGLADALDPEKDEINNLWSPQEGPQTMAFYSEADETFFGGAAGGGKLLCNDSNVLTPLGWVKAINVNVGDMLIAGDGTHTSVVGVYPQKNIDMYKVTFADGATVTVGDEHLWFFWYSGKKIKYNRKYTLYSPSKGIRDVILRGKLSTTRQLYDYHKRQEKNLSNGKRPYWAIVPLCRPVHFTISNKNKYDNTLRIDPYLLGILLGDGCINININIKEDSVKDFLESIIPNDTHCVDNKCLSIVGQQLEDIKDELKKYKLYKLDTNKNFIPDDYLFSSVKNRFTLMQGLIDNDGYVNDRGHILYTTASEQLAKDVQHLSRSLGCNATITNSDDREYVVLMYGGNQINNFTRIPHKKDLINLFDGKHSESCRRITNIDYVGNGDGVCFAIDHPTGLHVVDDFIVTHNSDLMLGLAVSKLSPHKKSIVFRTTFSENKNFIARARKILEDTPARFKAGNQQIFSDIPDGKILEIASVMNFDAAQKYRGRDHDLKLFDEVTNMDENVYTFLIGWARTTDPSVPVRVVSAGNPPTRVEGQWVTRRWAPWIDPSHPNPAKPGELRWFAMLDGSDTEITPYVSEDGNKGVPFMYTTRLGMTEEIIPKSRTFIPAKLSDNQFLTKEYRAVLQGMPEPLRSQLLYGDFGLSFKPDPWQVIPMEWIHKAESRWLKAKDDGTLESTKNINVGFGLDVAEAGGDNTVLTKMSERFVQWIDIIEADTKNLTDIPIIQAQIVANKLMGVKGAAIGIDAIGVGLALASQLRQRNFNVVPLKTSRVSNKKDKTGIFTFLNVRSEMWWRLREALDPDNENAIGIPPDARLRLELSSVKYERTQNDKIKIENKDKIRDRIKKSPDLSESLILALYVQRRSTGIRMV